jgi:hypothetical protein
MGNAGSSEAGKESDPSDAVKPAFDNAFCNLKYMGSSADLESGNLYDSHALGPLTISYNSSDPAIGPLGIGWTHAFNLSLTSNPDGSLTFRRGDGSQTNFSANSQGVYVAGATSGDSSSIAKNTDGSFTKSTVQQKTYSFDATGRLTGVVDRNGNAMTLA